MHKPLASLLAALFLTACATKAGPPLSEPVAPRVDCQQPPSPDVPDWPDNWALQGPEFAITVLGLLTDERLARGHEHACLNRLKAAGQIR